jgi:hypothetical protein
MMGAAGPDSHVQKADPAGGLDVLAEMAVLAFGEPQPVQMGAPQQASHDHAGRRRRLGQHPRHLAARAVQQLIGVASPVREQQKVPMPAVKGP